MKILPALSIFVTSIVVSLGGFAETEITSSANSGGGGVSAGGNATLTATLGQPVAGGAGWGQAVVC